METFHKAPLEGALPVHEPALGVEAAEALGEAQLVLVIPLDRDVQGLYQSSHRGLVNVTPDHAVDELQV